LRAVISHTQIYLQLTLLWERCYRQKEIVVGVWTRHDSKCDVPQNLRELNNKDCL